jgi:hypothetical protein
MIMRGSDMLTNFALGFNFLNNTKLINLSENSAKSLPTHNIKSLPDATKQFLQWFVGFVDAEGCFAIHPNKS